MENNIGKLNAIFVQNLNGTLKRKDGKKIIKEYTNLYLKNKPLLKEYMVFDYIEKIENGENLKDYVNESIGQLSSENKKVITKLNEDVCNFLTKHKIEKIKDIENEKLYEYIHNSIFSDKNLKLINEKVENVNNIIQYIKENKELKSESSITLPTENLDKFIKFTVNKFNKKYEESLNENEKEIFKTITSQKTEEDKQNLFETKRNECLKLTNDFLNSETDNATKSKLLTVKEKLTEQKYVCDTFIKDVLSFVELKETLE